MGIDFSLACLIFLLYTGAVCCGTEARQED